VTGLRDEIAAAIDADHIAHQREWSTETFGPDYHGVIDHIRKELAEVEESDGDLSEWVDVIILAFDGAWRSGAAPQEIIDAIKAKQVRNEARTWPDWRTRSADFAIEHVRDAKEPPPALLAAIDARDEEIERLRAEPTDAEVEAFRREWQAADREGDAGNRVRRGLRAAREVRHG
jgi:hypothetical protein